MANNLNSTLQISEKYSHILPYLSEIKEEDKFLLQKMIQTLRPHSKNYEDSWGYIVQATRHDGFKWYDPYSNSLIFFGRKSDFDPRLVIPVFFAEPEYLSYVIEKVQKVLDTKKTILKNVNLENVSSLGKFGFREYKEGESWSNTARFDDQTYPQLIISLKKLIEAKGAPFRPLRKALNKNHPFIIRRYRENDKDAVLKIFELKDSIKQSNNIYFSSHAMYPDANIDKFVILDDRTKEIIGFTAASDISPTITSLVASLFKTNIKHIGIWSMYQTLAIKYAEGFTLASLGGSETKSTFSFKVEKFCPVEQLAKTHLIYDL